MSDLESTWSQVIEWNALTVASRDNFEGHLKTTLKVHSPSSVSGFQYLICVVIFNIFIDFIFPIYTSY